MLRAAPLRAETRDADGPLLKPRKVAPPKTDRGLASEGPELKPRQIQKRPEDIPKPAPFLKVKDRPLQPPVGFSDRPGISVLYQTPLIHETTYEKRFSTFGLAIPVSVPLIQLSDTGASLHLEFGVSATLSRLNYGPSDVSFSHTYFYVPLRLRAQLPLGNKLTGEVGLGAQVRLFEYDSRSTLDGGFRVVDGIFENIEPDFAVGLNYCLGEALRLRGFLGYLFGSVGVEFLL